MHRRKFLKLSALGGGALLALPGLGFIAVTAKEAVAAIIMRQFDYLQLDEKGVAQFVEDYFAAHPKMAGFDKKLRSYYLLRLDASQSELIDHLTRNYLQSTDFFRNKMDESLPVNYLGLYNPYKTPCANPFSALYYPAAPTV